MWGEKADLPKDWGRIRRRVLRASDICCICDLPGADEVDHRIPRYAGGSDELTNLRPVHKACHARKSSQEGHAQKRKLRDARRRPVGKHPGQN